MRGLAERMQESGLAIHLTEPARRWLAQQGFDREFGARPLRRAIQRHIENPLSMRLLKGDFNDGDLVVIDERDGGLHFTGHADQQSDYAERGDDQAAEFDTYYDDNYGNGEYYDDAYDDGEYADFLSRTADD